MVLGTLLGDGCLCLKDTHPRYRCVHGRPQKDYCALKELLIRNFVKTPVKEVENKGFGDRSVVFNTLTSPEFDFLIPLCFRPHPVTGKLKKTVTQEWASILTWEMIAWWFMDDGCKQGPALAIATHSFSKEEVDILANRLTEMGCPAHAHKTRKGKAKTYYILKIPTESVPVFEENVRPFILPMMRYKLEETGPSGMVLNCTFCGKEFAGNGRHKGGQGKTPCCRRPTCKKKAVALRAKVYEKNLGGPQARYQREKAVKAKRPPEELERLRRLTNERQNARLAAMSPEEKAKFLQRKRDRRAALKLAKSGR